VIGLILAFGTSNGFCAFTYYRSVTIDHTKVSSPGQSSFPVLVAGTYNGSGGILDLRTVGNGGKVQNASGYDVGFYTNSNCSTGKMNWETENYNATTGEAEYWINVTSLSSSADTIFYVCYGDSGISSDQSNKTAVWDSSYLGVWHFPDGSTLNKNDSTSNGQNGENYAGAATATAGQIDGAANLTPSDTIGVYNYLNDFVSESFTISVWMKPPLTGQNNYASFVNRGYYYSAGWYFQINNSDNHDGVWFATNQSGASQLTKADSSLNLDSWNLVTVVRDGSVATIYINATDRTSYHDTHINPTPLAPSPMWMTFGSAFKGVLDQVEISSTARSSAWISTQYANQNSPSTFFTIGSESGGGSSSGPNPGQNGLVIKGAKTVIKG
jgi:hypothetical protein